MKKLVLFAAVVIAVSFASCKQAPKTCVEPVEEIEAVDEAVEAVDGDEVIEVEVVEEAAE